MIVSACIIHEKEVKFGRRQRREAAIPANLAPSARIRQGYVFRIGEFRGYCWPFGDLELPFSI